MPVTIQVEGPEAEQVPAEVKRPPRPRSNWFGAAASRLGTAFDSAAARVRSGTKSLRKGPLSRFDLATWLFFGALGLYLATRLIGLTKFPIFFFTDEALQTQFIADLIKNGYRNGEGMFLPPAFRNGDYFTLGMGVYTQWLPYVLFGKSAFLTRATSALVTVIAAVSVGLILRDALKVKYWWTGTLFLSITPAWFLHSRTAWETAEFTGLYAGALCAYVFYRIKSPRYLYLAIFLGALGFYTYSPAQVLVPVTALALLVSDWRYHWENRRTALGGLVLLAIMCVQYIRFRMVDPDNALAHLHTLGSYLLENVPLSQKVLHYFSEYFLGIGAWYWYTPNDRDLQRHLMKGYGHIMLATLPFALLGLATVLRHLRDSAHRTVLIAMLAAPVASALVYTGITRTMIFVVPAAILTAMGLDQVLVWIERPRQGLLELSRGAGFTRPRILAAAVVLVLGGICAFLAPKLPDRIAVSILAVILALQISGVFEWFAGRIKRSRFVAGLKRWNPSQVVIALAVFAALAFTNVYMLVDALTNGPTWYKDIGYGLGGMQYGGFQLFDLIKQYHAQHPKARIIFSPSWANGTDVVARFFLGDPLPMEMGSIEGHIVRKLPLDDNTLFIMMPEEYDLALKSNKFTDIRVERTVPYPDGKPGFYFVHLRYADNADEIFAGEEAFRAALQESTIKINGEDVRVRHSYLEANDQSEGIQLIFDNDPYTLAKTFEANPLIVELTYATPRKISGFSIITGSAHVAITVKCYATPAAQPVIYLFEGQGSIEQPQLSFDFAQPTETQVLYLEMLDVNNVPPPAKDHVWELTFR